MAMKFSATCGTAGNGSMSAIGVFRIAIHAMAGDRFTKTRKTKQIMHEKPALIVAARVLGKITMTVETSPEMRLFSPTGERLYLTVQERQRFLAALDEEEPINRLFCRVLHYSGCRPSEALELVPRRVLVDEGLMTG